jgi:Domain of unknown function (DUF397)
MNLSPEETQGRTDAALSWVKSTHSFANGNCVEVARMPNGGVGVRDSKDPQGPALSFTAGEWRAFIGAVQKGELAGFGEA